MTTELVLLLGIYAYIILGVFLGDMGPLATFKKSAPKLAARIERDITIGNNFRGRDGRGAEWKAPKGDR